LRLSLTALHLPGVQNQAADRLSRLGTLREYAVKPAVLRAIMSEFQFWPVTDIFGVDSEQTDRGAGRPSNGLRVAWRGRDLYLHPPITLLMPTVRKLRSEPTRAILIHPAWESQPWSLLIQERATRQKDLGPFDEVMDTTPRFRSEGWRLPPGKVRASMRDTRTTPARSTSLSL
jgi:hypothetical protein